MQALLPPLSVYERDQLKRSIDQSGVQMPILCLPDGRIIDGHHRFSLAGMDVPKQITDLPEDEALTLGLALNLARRHLSPEQVAEVHDNLRKNKELRKSVAMQARAMGKTQAEAAALVGVAQPTLAAWESESNISSDNAFIPDVRVSVPRSEYGAIYERHEAGETNAQIAADYKITQQRVGQIARLVEARDDIPTTMADVPLPDRKYRCIVIDPPWPMQKIEREVHPSQGRALDYPIMSLEAITALPIADLAYQDGCHIYLWVTQRFLPDGLHLFDAWDAKYQCLMTWVKPGGFTPFSWMYNTEHVIFGRIGNLPLERLGLKLSFEAPTTRHSAKPDVFYERAIQASPGPRLEMFARVPRSGFDVWGNEVV